MRWGQFSLHKPFSVTVLRVDNIEQLYSAFFHVTLGDESLVNSAATRPHDVKASVFVTRHFLSPHQHVCI